MRTNLVFATSLAALLACAACDNKGAGGDQPVPAASPSPATAPPPPTPSAAPSAPASPPAPKVEIAIASVANLMFFDKKTLTVPTGAEVHLVLKNNATQDTLPHNWVLLAKAGSEAKVAADGLAKAPDAGYVVPGDAVLAFTPLTPPGKTSEVTFIAPSPGTYPYICTFPGHYMMMKGILTVTP